MTTHKRFPSADMVFTVLAIALFSVTVVPHDAVAAEPSAAEILAESKAAMTQPMQYHLLTSGVEAVVYQKKLPDGSMASLSDTSSPIKKISITYGDKSYELYLEHRVAIDTRFKYQAARSQATSILSMLGGKPAESSKIIGTVNHGGKDCYEIESTLASDVVAALVKAAPPTVRSMMPAKFRYVIEKDTHLMVETEVISQQRSSISKVEFKDIKLRPDLSDDFFQLPPGLEVKKPKSMGEYMSLVVDMVRPKIAAIPKELPRRPKIGQTQASNPAAASQPQSMSIGRKTVLIVSSLALVVLTTVFVLRRLRKAR